MFPYRIDRGTGAGSGPRRLRRMVLLALSICTGVILPLAGLAAASAAVGGCRSDPVFTLSNGTVITLYETIADSATDVTGVHYDLHFPVGLSVTSVSYSGDIPASQQSWTPYNDELTNNYDTYTTVSTATTGIQVQAYLQAGSAQSLQQSGQSNQAQHIQLHVHANGGGVVTVTAGNQTMTYGSNYPQLTYSFSGFTNGDTAGVLAGSPFCSYTAPATGPAGSYPNAVVCTQGNLSSPAYTFVFVSGTLTVTPAPLTITASNAQINYGAPVTITPNYQGFVNNDTASALHPQPTCAPATTATVGTWATACSGAVDPNYAITYVNGTLQINSMQATVSLSGSDSSTVDVTSPGGVSPSIPVSATISASAGSIATALPVTYSLSGNNHSARVCTDSTGAGVGGNTLKSTCSFGSLTPGNYNLTVSTGGNYTGNAQSTLTVSTASSTTGTITVTAGNASMMYGANLPNVTWTYSGFQGTDTAAVLSGNPTCSSSVNSTSGAGTYSHGLICNQGTLSAQNYHFVSVPGTLTITPALLTITAGNAQINYGASVTITPSYQGFVNNDSASALNPRPTCAPSTTAAIGTWATTCSGAVDPNYAITYVKGTLQINSVLATVSLSSSDSATVDVTTPGGVSPNIPVSATISASAGSIATALPITYTLSGNNSLTVCTDSTGSGVSGNNLKSTCNFGGLAPGNYRLTVSTANGNYSGSAQSTLTVSTASSTLGTVTVTAGNASIMYGANLPNVTWTYTGFQGTDTANVLSGNPSCSSSVNGTTGAGTYPHGLVCTQGNLSAQNYHFVFVPGSLTVTPAPLTISAADGSMTYGATPSVTPKYQGLVNHDTGSSLSETPNCSASATSSSPAGQYTDSCWGAASPNYTISYTSGNFQVQPATATITLPRADTGLWTVNGAGAVPVSATISAAQGNISTALPIQYQLQPLLGGPPAGTCLDSTGQSVSGSTMQSSCSFSNVLPGVYALQVHEQSANYHAGDVSGGTLAVVDPSITTKASDNGQVNHNGTNGQMNFNVSYTTGVLGGSMNYTEHGTYTTTTFVSTKLTGMAVVPNPNNGQTTVYVTGQGTYNGAAGYSFVAMATSAGSTGTESTGLQVTDPNGAPVPYVSFNPMPNTGGQLHLN